MHPTSIIENIPVGMGKFIILRGFVVMDVNKSSQVIIILRSFLATIKAMVGVPVGKISFQLHGDKIYFYLPLAIAL